jgi:hypothetical protein
MKTAARMPKAARPVAPSVDAARNGHAQNGTEILDRLPPHDLNAERGVLGSVLLDPSIFAVVSPLLREDDFYADANRRLFRHFAAMIGEKKWPDITLIVDRLKMAGEYDAVGGAAYLAEIAHSVPYAHNAPHYAAIVKEKSKRRALCNSFLESLRATWDDGRDVSSIVDESNCELRQIRGIGTVSPVSLKALAVDHQALRPPVIDGLLRTGETMNLVAASKARKSWLTYSLALSVITGGKWLDTFACTPGRVCIIDGELHAETIVGRIRAVAEALEVQGYDEALEILPLRGKGIDLLELRPIIDAMDTGRYALVILDAWYRFLPPKVSENDNAAVMALYNIIDSYTSRLGSAWLNVHHASKGDQSGKGVVDVGSGAGSQSRAADSHLVIRPHREDDVAVIEAVVRSWPPVDPFCVRWNHPAWQRDDEADPRHLWTPQTARERAKDSRESHLDEDRQAVVNAMVALGRPETKTEIRTASGIGDNKRFDNAIGSLIRDKTVKPASVKKGNNRSYEGYEIAPG